MTGDWALGVTQDSSNLHVVDPAYFPIGMESNNAGISYGINDDTFFTGIVEEKEENEQDGISHKKTGCFIAFIARPLCWAKILSEKLGELHEEIGTIHT